METHREQNERGERPPIGDGAALTIGSLAGAAGGILLGVLIASIVDPGWTLTSAIIVFHVTLAMVAMGAWTAPSLFSDPEQEAASPAVAAGDIQPSGPELKSDLSRQATVTDSIAS
jgi:hypothetical protein